MSNGGSLEGKKILVTRAKEQAKSFSTKITELGGIPIEIPLIKFQASQNTEIINKTVTNLNIYDWIVFTSVNGVRFFFDFLEKNNIEFVQRNRPQIAVVGKKTLQPLREKGIRVDLVPDEFVAEGLIAKMATTVPANSRILIARGNIGRAILPEKLSELGMVVNDLIVYETVIDFDQKEELVRLLQNENVHMITFTSSSTVTYFTELLAGTPWRQWVNNINIACIGPITEKTALEVGFKPDVVASDYTIDGLIDGIVDFYNHNHVN